MPDNNSKAAIAQNGMLDAAAQLQQMKQDPAYLQVLKAMEGTIAKAVPKYTVVDGDLIRIEDEWATKRLADLKLMLDNYVENNYPLLKSSCD